MHKIVLIFFSCIGLSACNQKRLEEKTPDADSIHFITAKPDSSNIKTDAHYFWEAGFDDKTNKPLMKKVRPLSADSLTQDKLMEQINQIYPEIKLAFIKISNDTIFVKISNSNFLTQQMGSTGGNMYMSEVTYNLTELDNVNYVHFNFKAGDHAYPGTYSRTDFVNLQQ